MFDIFNMLKKEEHKDAKQVSLNKNKDNEQSDK